ATDSCGNHASAVAPVVVDGTAPVVRTDPTVQNACYRSVEAGENAVVLATTVTDNCSSGSDLTREVHSSVSECSLRVRIGAEDRCRNGSSSAITVRVDSVLPSVAIDRRLVAPRDQPCYKSKTE